MAARRKDHFSANLFFSSFHFILNNKKRGLETIKQEEEEAKEEEGYNWKVFSQRIIDRNEATSQWLLLQEQLLWSSPQSSSERLTCAGAEETEIYTFERSYRI